MRMLEMVAEATAAEGGRAGFDRVRGYEIGKKNVKLSYFEEAYTTQVGTVDEIGN
jgi:hypothetical protein